MTTACIDIQCNPHSSISSANLHVGCDGDENGVALLLFKAISAKTTPSQALTEQIIISGASLDTPRTIDEGHHYLINETESTIESYLDGKLKSSSTIAEFINENFVYHYSLEKVGQKFSPCVTIEGTFNKWAISHEDYVHQLIERLKAKGLWL